VVVIVVEARTSATAGQNGARRRSATAMAVTMYSTTWCGYCSRLSAQMAREGIEFSVVDIEVDPEAAAFVEGVNGGNQTVPTLLFPDGSTATNPAIKDVVARLAAAS
jgi:mycoredoxin